MALQLRRGTNKERLQITPVEGELIFVTDWELETITGTSIDGSTETITFSAAHGLSVGDQILFQSSTQLGLTQNTVYYVISAGLTTTACRVSLTSGGAAENLTTGSALTLIFAKTPTTAAGVPIGTNVTALWIGDGSTVGGIPGNTQGLNDLTDVEITTPNEGQTLYYDATTALWKNTSILEVNDVSNRIEVAGDIHATGDLVLNSDTGSNDVNITFTTGRTLKWDHGDQRYEFNTGDLYLTSDLIINGNDIKSSTGGTAITLSGTDVTTGGNLKVGGDIIRNSTGNDMITFATGASALTTLSGDLKISGNDIQSSSGSTAITLSGANVTIAGDLTVNGTTTTVNSTTLTVDDKNIELAATASPSDTTADGGGITLKGTTDKKIFWDNATDRWYIDNGDGNNYLIPVNLDDLNDVVVTSVAKGDLLFYDGSGWVNENVVQFDSAAQRTRFQYNISSNSGGINAGLVTVKNTGASAYTTGDGSGILIGVDDNSNPLNIFAGLSGAYSSTGNHEARLRSSTDSFVSNEKNLLVVNDNDLKVRATEFILNAEGTASAAVDAQITVERGTTGTDSYLKWDESVDRWEATNDFYAPQATFGTIDISRSGTQIDTNSGTNLTLDSDGGTVFVNDNLNVDSGVLYVDSSTNRVGVNTVTPAATLEVNGNIYGGDIVAVAGALGTNGENIYFNFDDGGTGATSNLVVRRGSNADVALRWNETDDRWETTVDGSTYIQLPNQDLDTDASPTFAGVTGGNIRVGVTGDNEIDTTSGGLTLDSSSGTVTVDDILAVNGNLNVDAGVLFVDVSNNYVGINDATPSYPLDVTGDTNVVGTIYATGLDIDNVRIGLAATNGTNTIDTSTGNLILTAASTFEVEVVGDFNVDSGTLKVDSTNNRVGVMNITPSYALDVTGDIRATVTGRFGNIVLDTGSAGAATFDSHTTSNLAAAATGTIASTTGRSMKAVIKITEDTTGECHMVEALLMRKGTTDTYITTYGEIYSSAALATFAADYDSGSATLRLRATSTATNTIDISVVTVSID